MVISVAFLLRYFWISKLIFQTFKTKQKQKQNKTKQKQKQNKTETKQNETETKQKQKQNKTKQNETETETEINSLKLLQDGVSVSRYLLLHHWNTFATWMLPIRDLWFQSATDFFDVEER